jgi:hypothetical protein
MSKVFRLLSYLKGCEMNRVFLTAIFLIIFTSFMNLNAQWARTYGGSNNDEAESIQQTSDGGYIVAGMTDSFGAGEYDIWVLKLSPDGEIEWQKTYGGSGSDGASSIQQTSDGGYIVAGRTDSFVARYTDIWILKLSPDGEIEWQKTYGGSASDRASSIQQTNDGGYIVASKTRSFFRYNDFWILKLSPDAEIEWQKIYGGSDHDFVHSIQQTSDGGYIVAGYTFSWGAGSEDFWVLKLSSDGIINPRCSFIRSSNAEVSDTDISPVVTNTTPRDKDITSQDTNIIPQDTDATVYNFCSEKPLLSIFPHKGGLSSYSGGGTTDPAPGTYIHEPGTEITITAFPFEGYRFIFWSGDASGETNPITIIMDSDKSIIAGFSSTQTGGSGDGDGGGKKGGCFIATAAYSSPLHSHVSILRDFRDRYLMPNKLGREFVDLYYKNSPFIANIIARNSALRVIVQINLTPFVVFSYSMVHLGPIVTGGTLLLILVLPFFLLHFCRRN